MKKTLLYIFTVLLSTVAFSQVTGKIVYEVNMDRFKQADEHEDSGSPSYTLLVKTAELAEDSRLELLFNEQMSLFRHQKGLSMEENEFAAFAKELVCQGDYYTNSKENKSLFITEFGGQVLNVAGELNKIEWVLSKETKKIGEFTCYKALYQKEIAGKRKEVVAWYTTDIPLAYGPKEYGGTLPGLILELDEPVARYICTEVILNKKQKLTWPKNISAITQEEYDEKTEQAWQSIKN